MEAGTSLLTGPGRKLGLPCLVELHPLEPCFPDPPFAGYPGLMGLLSLLNEDRVGLPPSGRMSCGVSPERRCKGRMELLSGFYPTLASGQIRLLEPGPGPGVAGLDITIIAIHNNNS